MTKGEAYKLFGLNMDEVNFDKDEVADDKFLEGCKVIANLRTEKAKKVHEEHYKKCVDRYGEEVAEHLDKLAFTMAVAELTGSIELGKVIAILFDNGCPLIAVEKAIDYIMDSHVNDLIKK